jgi:hypothetical protein
MALAVVSERLSIKYLSNHYEKEMKSNSKFKGKSLSI